MNRLGVRGIDKTLPPRKKVVFETFKKISNLTLLLIAVVLFFTFNFMFVYFHAGRKMVLERQLSISLFHTVLLPGGKQEIRLHLSSRRLA